MQRLDAAIAFALTLGGLASVVSIIIEIIHRVLSLRSKGLRAMLEQHFNDVIVPAIKTKVEQTVQGGENKLAEKLERLREDLIEKMTATPWRSCRTQADCPKGLSKRWLDTMRLPPLIS